MMPRKKLSEIKNYRQAQYYLRTRYDELAAEFSRQHPYIDTGGFYLPRVRSFANNQITFWCHYRGFDNEEDGWTWILDIETGVFYH